MDRLTEISPYWLNEELWVSAKEPDDEEIEKVYIRLWEYENINTNGCDYCNSWMIDATMAFINNPPDGSTTTDVTFNFCPNCGKKL